MAGAYGEPIYQAYVDAVKAQVQTKNAQLEMGLHAVELQQGIINIQNQIAERKAISQAYQQDAQQQQKDSGVNPITGQSNIDPAERTAQTYDRIAQNISRFNPKLALEYSTKASTLRDQSLTRKKNQIEISTKQSEVIGNIFGSIAPGDQDGYTEALSKAADLGIDIGKMGLTGNVVQDMPKLQQIAKGTLTYKEKLTAEHQKATEDQALLTYQERVRYDTGRLNMEGAGLGLKAEEVNLRRQFHADDMAYKSRADARAQAGLDLRDNMDLAKSKDFAGRVGKGDASYVQSVIEADPTLSKLGDAQKKAAAQEMVLAARSAMAKQVTKAGQTVTADDFTRAIDAIKPLVIKRTTPETSGFLGFGAKAAAREPLPQAIDTKDQFNQLPIGGQFRKGDKMYKKTTATDAEEIK